MQPGGTLGGSEGFWVHPVAPALGSADLEPLTSQVEKLRPREKEGGLARGAEWAFFTLQAPSLCQGPGSTPRVELEFCGRGLVPSSEERARAGTPQS